MVKASECFRVFFPADGLYTNFAGAAGTEDDTMARFEQDSYADMYISVEPATSANSVQVLVPFANSKSATMYRIQLRNWLPWQLGNTRAKTLSQDVSRALDNYVSSKVQAGSHNPFFKDGVATASRHNLSQGPPSSAWSRINDLQWQNFHAIVANSTLGDSLVLNNAFSRWGSLSGGQIPRYVTAFSPGRDSGDFLGLSCPHECGERFSALRVVTFLERPQSREAQLKVLDLAHEWSTQGERYSLTNVVFFVLRRRATPESKVTSQEVSGNLQGWKESALSKLPGTAVLQSLAEE
jgi:hypothetical protein